MPKVLLGRGVSDCVRISDARMSGTSFGTVVLHVSPESGIGGPLAVVETGDRITLSVARRSLELHITEEKLRRRPALLAGHAIPPKGSAIRIRRKVAEENAIRCPRHDRHFLLWHGYVSPSS